MRATMAADEYAIAALAQTLKQAEQQLHAERIATQRQREQIKDLTGNLERVRDAYLKEVRRREGLEAELEQLRADMKRLLDGVGAARWELDLGTQRVKLSPQWGELLGEFALESESHLDQLAARVPEDERMVLRAFLIDTLRGNTERYLVTHRYQSIDGLVWLNVQGAVTERDANGRAVRMIGTVQRCDELVGLRRAVDRSEDRLRAVTETMWEPVALLDRLGRVVHANRAWLALLGLQTQAAAARPLHDFLASRDRGSALLALARLTPEMPQASATARMRDAEGRVRLCDLQFRQLDAPESFVASVVVSVQPIVAGRREGDADAVEPDFSDSVFAQEERAEADKRDWLAESALPPPPPAPTEAPPPRVLELDRLIAVIGENRQALLERAEWFDNAARRELLQIGLALDIRNAANVQIHAQELRGLLLEICAMFPSTRAARLAEAAMSADWHEAFALVDQLRRDVSAITAAIRGHAQILA
jgi:PAS domain S-box-containing protein